MTDTIWRSKPDLWGNVPSAQDSIQTSFPLQAFKDEWLRRLFPAIFRGPPGRGKTHTVVEFLKAYTSAFPTPYTSTFLSMLDFENLLDEEMQTNRTTRGILGNLGDARVLVLDDLGTERQTDFLERSFGELMRQRVMKCTILTTNLSDADILARYGSRIHSRLKIFSVISFAGPDLRQPWF